MLLSNSKNSSRGLLAFLAGAAAAAAAVEVEKAEDPDLAAENSALPKTLDINIVENPISATKIASISFTNLI